MQKVENLVSGVKSKHMHQAVRVIVLQKLHIGKMLDVALIGWVCVLILMVTILV